MPESVRAFVPAGRRFHTLGTEGFGRSDTRAALRAFFQVDAESIAQVAYLEVSARRTAKLQCRGDFHRS